MGKNPKILIFISGLLFIFLLVSCSQSAGSVPTGIQYYSPLQNAEYVSKDATIIFRYGPDLSNQDLAGLTFDVKGSESGEHAGQIILADDQKTIIFKPSQPFTPSEHVTVSVNRLQLDAQTSYGPFSYSFTVSTNQQPGTVGSSGPATTPPNPAFPDFLTLPQDIPHYTVFKSSPENKDRYIFVAPFYWTKSTLGSYLLILNTKGQIVYYQSAASAENAFDFTVQPNGLLSFYDHKKATIFLMDSHYQVVDQYDAGNGYTADLHDFQILPNGNALLLAYDTQTVDMSKVVKGGKKDAEVTGLVIQELDPSKNVIFEWRSWDHIPYTDSTVNLTEQKIDLIHGNALAYTTDGNLLVSSRNLCEVFKIDLQTGEVLWRFGGKANQFNLTEGKPFAFQHDVRQLPNGDITIFDNQGTEQNPAPSHAIQYRLDETSKTATQVWEFTHNPPVFGMYMGNTQRLDNGNTFISWGAPSTDSGYAYITMTELSPDNQTVFEMAFDQPYVSYRAFTFPWQGFPDTLPALDSKTDSSGLTLGYSWNGSTEVAAYQLLGGSSPQSLSLIEQKAKIDFETQSHLTNQPQNECYFQVVALDHNGNELSRSKVISTDSVNCPLSS